MLISNTSNNFISFIRYAYAILRGVFLAFICLLIINTWAFTFFVVRGSSMAPTLKSGQPVLVNISAFILRPPERNEVVIVEYAGDSSLRFVKRITGLPGDIISYQGKNITLGPDMYFIVGDNSSHSTDSRTYGPVMRSQIIGKVYGY